MGKSKNKHSKHHHAAGHHLHGVMTDHAIHDRLKDTAINTVRDLGVGVVGGGLLGAAIGKPSLLLGIALTGAGHFSNNKIMQLLGLGMMAANGFQSGSKPVAGLEGGMEGVSDRVKAYGTSFAQKFYLDRFLKKPDTTTDSGTGMGEVQYFTYPDALNGDLAALNDIENQLTRSALEFQGNVAGNTPVEARGDIPELSDAPSDPIMGDVEDKLY